MLKYTKKTNKLISIYFDGKYIRENLYFNAIACGAAVQAALFSGFNDGIIGNIKYKDIATFSIGLEYLGEVVSRVIEKGTLIPMKESLIINVPAENQSEIIGQVYQGERALASNNHFLALLQWFNLPRLNFRVKIYFHIDSSGIVTVSGDDERINLHKKQLSQEKIESMQGEIENEMGLNKDIGPDQHRYKEAFYHYIRKICRSAFTDCNCSLSNYEKSKIQHITNHICLTGLKIIQQLKLKKLLNKEKELPFFYNLIHSA